MIMVVSIIVTTLIRKLDTVDGINPALPTIRNIP